MNAILLEAGYLILNIKAKDRLEFNNMMLKFYDGDDITPSIKYLTEYYVLQNSRLI
jgi:hypothetical protein